MSKSVWVLPAAVVLGFAITNAQERHKPTDATDDILIADERALHDAVAKADRSAFLSLVAPEGAWTTPQGFVPMNLLADGLSEFRLSKSEVVNPRVTQLSDDSAVLLYAWTVTGTFGDQPLPATMLSSTVWAKRHGKWVAVHHQDTELRRN
jgi:hypothetical protein